MTLHTPVSMTKNAFLAWVERQEGRYEYAGGRVVMMVRVTMNHAVVTADFVVALRTRLEISRYVVVAEAFAVDVGNSVRFPDVVVEPVQADGKALKAAAPLLIVEVLSPGSLHQDFGDKLREYLSLSTLAAYVIASPDEPRLWLWHRDAEGAFPPEPEIIEGPDKSLSLPTLGVDIPFAEIYRGVR